MRTITGFEVFEVKTVKGKLRKAGMQRENVRLGGLGGDAESEAEEWRVGEGRGVDEGAATGKAGAV